MREVRDVIFVLADKNFDVSFFCFYMYIMNYKKGINQVKRYYIGRNVNVNISFYKVFSIGDFKYLVKVYWFILYVNFICDEVNQYKSFCMIDFKDVKCIINGELFFVFKFGKIWKSIEFLINRGIML